MTFTQDNFSGVRARYQSLCDFRLFNGWVLDLHDNHVVVRSSPDVVLITGEFYAFEVYSQKRTALFTAKLTLGSDMGTYVIGADKGQFELRQRIMAAADMEFEFEITSDIKFASNKDTYRTLSERSLVSLEFEDRTLTATMVDVSEKGIGLLVAGVAQKGESCLVSIQSHEGEVSCRATVRYCRPDKHAGSVNRLGLNIQEMGRIDLARWHKLCA